MFLVRVKDCLIQTALHPTSDETLNSRAYFTCSADIKLVSLAPESVETARKSIVTNQDES